MANVVVDTDFLSSFLKIGQLHLVRGFFRAERLSVPAAVYREIAITTLLPALASLDWIQIREIERSELTELAGEKEFSELGAGEQEAICLAGAVSESVLLMNDKRAGRYARSLGIDVVDIPAFLLAYRRSGQGTAGKVRDLVGALQDKDYYGFPKSVLEQLLQ